MRRLFTIIVFACLAQTAGFAAEPIYSAVPAQMQAQLDKQRASVSDLVTQKLPGKRLSASRADLALLQSLLDEKVVPPSDTWKLQALGVAFGDVLVSTVPALAWAQVTDEYGTDPTLRYRKTTIQINALTTISKRVERGESVDVQQLARELSAFIAKRAKEYP